MRSTAEANLLNKFNRPKHVSPDFESQTGLDAEIDSSEMITPKAPFILSLIAISLFFPGEASFDLGGLRMTAIRTLLLLVAPGAIWRLLRTAIQRSYIFVWSDALVPVTSAWMFVGPITVDGFDKSIAYCGSSALEFFVPYMAARAFLRERGQAVALIRVLSIAIATTGLLAIIDEVTGRYLIRETFGTLFGTMNTDGLVDYAHPEQRGFLLRVPSTLDHPILLGTVCVYGLLLATVFRGFTRLYVLLGSATGLILAASSAPIVGTAMGFGCLIFERITRDVPRRWTLLAMSAAAPLILIMVVHPSPLSFFLNHLTIDPQTGYYRLLQWDCAGALVLDSPIIGLGLSNDWADYCHIAKTIDLFWLREAMLYGIPGAVMIFLCFVTACLRPRTKFEGSNLTEQERHLKFVLTTILGVTIWIGITVHFWASAYILTLFLAGIQSASRSTRSELRSVRVRYRGYLSR